eukprot:CAMPEP_0201277592 /NCGR_PEP_ID=MMETSP0853-20130426/59634_1 /ASSEMBLY_ACC=CAM_ASM_000640 /TAXON_ID=183588 /ORGANISM="Pseudo-nitzschia fraudulenta, Strain WWA7" /LENGTH=444 /DNA_ID=CAMNT_0047585773 /DNA_START=385 /DNA_END=1720 /DNA_ORIENTATION=+
MNSTITIRYDTIPPSNTTDKNTANNNNKQQATMNSTIAPTLDGAQSGADPVLLHVLFATAILAPAVSVALSLLVVVSILLTLALEPKKRTRAMSFNLYLVFLSAGDLCMAAMLANTFAPFYRLELDGTEDFREVVKMTAFKGFDGPSVLVLLVGANTMPIVAAFVCHEILKLLRNSKQRKRCKPPTLRTAALHGVLSIVAVPAGGVCTFYPLWVAYRVFVREKLLRAGAGVGNRLRVLSVYFGRIVVVYSLGFLVMGIVMCFVFVGDSAPATITFSISFVWGFQGWVSFGIIMTKPDVKKMVCDLLTGRLFRCRNRQEPERANETSVATRPVSGWSSHPGGGNNNDDGSGGGPVPGHENQNQTGLRDFIDGIEDYLSENEDDGNNAGDGGGNGGGGGSNDDSNHNNTGDGSNTDAPDDRDPEAIAMGEIRQESPDSNGTMSQQA